MEACGDGGAQDDGGIGGPGCGEDEDEAAMVDEGAEQGGEGLERAGGGREHALGDGGEGPADGDAGILHALLGLLQLGLGGGVGGGKLALHAGPFGKGSGGLLLGGAEVVEVGGQCGEHLCGARSVELELVEDGGDAVHAARVLEPFDEGEEGGIGVGAQQAGELLHLEPCHGGHVGGLAEEGGEDVLQGGGSLFHAHHRLVEHGGEGHNLGLGDAGGVAHSGEARGELHDVGLGGGGGLRELVDHGGRGEHALLEAEGLVDLEELGELADLLDGVLAQVLAEGHVDHVGGFDKLLHAFPALDAEASGIGGQGVELLAWGAGVHASEGVVEGGDVALGQPGVLAHVGQTLVHLGIFAHQLSGGGGEVVEHGAAHTQHAR